MVEDEIEATTQTITSSFSDKMSITNLNKKKKRRIRHTSSGRSHRADSMDMDEDTTGSSSPRVVAFAPLPKHRKSNKTQRVVSKIRLQSIQKSATENETRDESMSPTSRKRARVFGSTNFEESSKKRHGTYLSGKDGVVIVVRVLPLVIRKESNGQWFVKWNDEDLNVATELGYSLSSVKQMSKNERNGDTSPRHLGAVNMRVQWVGMPRISTTQSARMDATMPMQDRMELQDILSNFGCIPVWPSSEIMRCHHVFCTEILRPVIHNVYDPYVCVCVCSRAIILYHILLFISRRMTLESHTRVCVSIVLLIYISRKSLIYISRQSLIYISRQSLIYISRKNHSKNINARTQQQVRQTSYPIVEEGESLGNMESVCLSLSFDSHTNKHTHTHTQRFFADTQQCATSSRKQLWQYIMRVI